MTKPIQFSFYTEAEPGHETAWTVTADVSFEHDRYFAELTGAHPRGEAAAEYDVSDLEWALAEDGRSLADVEQAAIDAFVEDAEETGAEWDERRDEEIDGSHDGDENGPSGSAP